MPTKSTLFCYERTGSEIRLLQSDISPLEIQQVSVGLRARLDPDDREEHMRELLHFHCDPGTYLTEVASAVTPALVGDHVVDLRTVERLANEDLPVRALIGATT